MVSSMKSLAIENYKLSGHAMRYWEGITSHTPNILGEILWKFPPRKLIKCWAGVKETRSSSEKSSV